MVLTLGTRKRRSVILTDEQRSRHIHVLGASGTGKSKLLESLIRQDILRGRGVCLIDPHGTLADAVLEWCAAIGAGSGRNIHVLSLQDEDWSMGFNPLGIRPGERIESRVDAMVAACAEVWGGEDLDRTPLLATSLQLVFYALAANNLTLAEALDLTGTAEGAAVRQSLTSRLQNGVYADYWREYGTLSRREFEERFSSARRRLLRFLASPSVRRIIGQRDRVLDVRGIMDRGEILIVNLAQRGEASEENGRLLGALLMSELRICAMRRDPDIARTQPFSLYVDECYDFLTGDVERMLDQTRKFGLHVVLSHQRLGQLRSRSEAIYNGVMAGGQNKIVFGGMADEDAEVMAREIMRSRFNLERPKHVLDKPTVVDEIPFWLESTSATESSSSTESESESSAWNESSGSFAGSGEHMDAAGVSALGMTASSGESTGYSSGGGSSSGWGRTTGESHSRGQSQTLKPIRVSLPTAVYSLEEETHLAIIKLRELPNQTAIVKRRGHPPIQFRPAAVKPGLVWPEASNQFAIDVRERSAFVTRSELVDAEIDARNDALRTGQSSSMADEPPFWSE